MLLVPLDPKAECEGDHAKWRFSTGQRVRHLIPSELAEVNGELHVARWRVSVAGKTIAQRGMTQAGDASGSGLGGLHSWDI